ncbi:MAG TPA: hypothetical protein VG839_01130 [Asticcacaulis sp.]|nr:hypothetical protein [Asticcacaulis sp.]
MVATARKTPDDKVTPLKLTAVKTPAKSTTGKATKDNLLQMWSKLVDLHMFNDNVKQERLRNFMMIEAVIMLGFTVALAELFAVPNLGGELVFIVLSFTLCIMGFMLARRTEHMDMRTSHYVRTIKNQLHHVENQLKPMMDGDMLPYEGQFKVLNEHTLQLDVKGNYSELTPKDIKTRGRLIQSHAAGFHERLVIRATGYVWAAAFFCVIITGTVMLTPALHIGMERLSQEVMHGYK